MSDLHQEKLPIGGDHHESRLMVAIAMAAISAAFMLSLAMAVSSITHSVKTAVTGAPPSAMSAPETTGSNGNRG